MTDAIVFTYGDIGFHIGEDPFIAGLCIALTLALALIGLARTAILQWGEVQKVRAQYTDEPDDVKVLSDDPGFR